MSVDLEPLSEQDKILDLAAFGPEIDEYTSARYLPSRHLSRRSILSALIEFSSSETDGRLSK
jgi:hypothetical protein